MRFSRASLAVVAVAACSSGGVVAGTDASQQARACVAGMQTFCPCLGGGQGIQVCAHDGSSFSACEGCDGTVVITSTTSASSSAGAGTSTYSDAGGEAGSTSVTGATSTASTSSTTGATSSSGPPCAPLTDLDQATLYDNPPDLATWPVTTTLTEVDFTSGGVALQFSKQSGADAWPNVPIPGWNGGMIQYTLGMVECIGGQWYTSAVIEFWAGLPASGGNVAEDTVTMGQCTAFGASSTCQVATNWYYDPVRWGTLAGIQPATGDLIGIFVAAGNLRDITDDDTAQSPVMERSNVVVVPMPDLNGSTNGF